MDFFNPIVLPEVGGNSKTKPADEAAKKKKKQQMAKASRRMNRYRTKSGYRTKNKRSLRVRA